MLLMPHEAAKLASTGISHLNDTVIERINSRLKWAKVVGSDDYNPYYSPTRRAVTEVNKVTDEISSKSESFGWLNLSRLCFAVYVAYRLSQ